jgi:hypothetical protein
MVDGFQGKMTDAGLPVHQEASEAQILVTTPALCGTGFTITRAFRMVIMEPAWLKSVQRQAFSRIIRISQLNAKTWTYLLFSRRDETESKIRTRQRRREILTRAAFEDLIKDSAVTEFSGVEITDAMLAEYDKYYEKEQKDLEGDDPDDFNDEADPEDMDIDNAEGDEDDAQ